MLFRSGQAGEKVVIEEFLQGEEASFMALTDGEHILPLASSQDHKRVFDGDRGPNTGGMGAYSPAPVVTPEVHCRILDEILKPLLVGLKKKGVHYSGVIYVGLMVTSDGPKVLEFNARFGDPGPGRGEGRARAGLEMCAVLEIYSRRRIASGTSAAL